MVSRFTPSKRGIRNVFLISLGLAILWLVPMCPVAVGQAPVNIDISVLTDIIPGQFISIPVVKSSGDFMFHGFDMLFAYDTTALEYVGATPGVLYTIPGQYEWEYFTYRTSTPVNCDEFCPPGLVKITSLAETANGPHHPQSRTILNGTELFTLNFLVKDKPEIDCGFYGVRFYWSDCSDNGIAIGPIEDISLGVSDTIWDVSSINIADTGDRTPTFYGFPSICFEEAAENEPVRVVEFNNGGVFITCNNPYSERGDIDLDSSPYQLADRDLLIDYFLHGSSVFAVNPAEQTAASDIKGDGWPLTIEDLIYLDRIIDSTLAPWPYSPVTTLDSFIGLTAIIETDSSLIVRAECNKRIGAGYFIFDAPGMQSGEYQIKTFEESDHMEIYHDITDNKLSIVITGRRDLVGDQAEIDSVTLPAGPLNMLEIVYETSPPMPDTLYATGYYGGKINMFVADVPNHPPVFNQYPSQLTNQPYGGFEYDFLAFDPNMPTDSVSYNLISGPGTIDAATGFWHYIPICDEPGSSWILRVCASDLTHPCPQDETSLHAIITLKADNPLPKIGDADLDGQVNLIDILFLIDHIYHDGPKPSPEPDIADVNFDGELNLLDILAIIDAVYSGDPALECP